MSLEQELAQKGNMILKLREENTNLRRRLADCQKFHEGYKAGVKDAMPATPAAERPKFTVTPNIGPQEE